MRDILADLQDRARSVAEQISDENARFESLVSQLRAELDGQLEHLRAQLRLANKLIEFTAWHDRVRAELTSRIAVAETAETAIKNSFVAAAEQAGHP